MTQHDYRPDHSREDEYWDGIDRRQMERRYHQVPPPMYYYPPQQPPPMQDSRNVAQATLTLQQIGGIALVIGSILFSGFSAWSNLNSALDIQQNNFDQFKGQIGRDLNNMQDNIKELKRISDEVRTQNKQTADSLEHRIQELDASLAQIYQKISSSK